MAMNMLPGETELLDRQRALQVEAAQVARDIKLMELAKPLGDPILVGSAALGLMVWRDLDVTVVCPRLDIDAVVQVGSRLALHARMREVVFQTTPAHGTRTRTRPTPTASTSASRIARPAAMTGKATSGLSMNQTANRTWRT
jgi:hypothetical protein